MRDPFGRPITYLRLAVTDRCNLRCRYCVPEECGPAGGAVLSGEALVEIARQAVLCGVKKIRLTGGEPLVRRDIAALCRSIADLEGLEELCITTNGTALETLAGPLREAGVDRLNVSLDSLRPQRYAALTRGGRLEDVLEGLRAAERAGFTGTKLNVVLLRGVNQDEIPDFVDLTRRFPLEVRFIELMPMVEGAPGYFLPAGEVLQQCPDLVPAGSGGVARRYRLPGAPGLAGLITPMSCRFCAECDRIRVTADGMLKPCLHSEREIDLRGLTGEALRQAIASGAAAKPERHYLAETGHSEAGRTMNRIGG